MKKIFFFLFLSVFIYQIGVCQNVGIATTTPRAPFNVAENKTVLFGFDTTALHGSRFYFSGPKNALRIGTRVDIPFGAMAWDYGNIGFNSVAFGSNNHASGTASFAAGDYNQTPGEGAVALGWLNISQGRGSFTTGYLNHAKGFWSQGIGYNNIAHVDFSFASGFGTGAYGRYSATFGNNVFSNSHNMFSVGAYNDTLQYANADKDSWIFSDPLFVIGNGSNVFNKSNAMVINKGGSVGINTATTWTDSYDGMLHVKGKAAKVLFTLESQFSANRWGYYVSSFNNLDMYYNSAFRGSFNSLTGAYTSVSDIRMKKDIRPFTSVLERVLKLVPFSYHYLDNDSGDPFSHGFMAQDVEKIFPDMVSYTYDKENKILYGLNYNNFSVLAIKAIQEQQEIITIQQKRIDDLERRLQVIESKLR